MGQFPSVRFDLAYTSNVILKLFGYHKVASILRVGGWQWNVGIDLSGQVKGNTDDFSKEWRDSSSSCPGN